MGCAEARDCRVLGRDRQTLSGDGAGCGEQYAKSTQPLIVGCHALGLGRGCSIKYLSVFPKEQEYLYPPLTYLVRSAGCLSAVCDA